MKPSPIRALFSRIAIALVLFAAATIAWANARALGEEAIRRERLATLRPIDEGEASLATRATAWMREGEVDRARAASIAEYWRGRYDALVGTSAAAEHDQDAQVLLIKANAAYRTAAGSRQSRQALMQQLDAVLQGYAAVLKTAGFVADAAYNYEFVARQRETLGRSRGTGAQALAEATAVSTSADLPAGPTIHGRPGGPPPRVKAEEFEILAPMEFGDRETQPEPNAGGKPVRKG